MQDASIGTFTSYRGGDEERRGSLLAALFTSSAIYVLIGVAVVFVGSFTHEVIKEKAVDITFTEKIVQPEPPPPPVVEVKPEPAPPPPVAAPVVPKNMKIRKLDAPPPPKELVAPKEVPLEAPKEADPSQDKGIAVYGDPSLGGDPAGLEGGAAGARAGAAAIALPEDADPPMPLKSNDPPAYPQEARAAGKTGMVILKVVIRADGSVADVEVMRGDEPFVSSAVAAVRKWKYEPAKFKGQAITVYRIIQIPFKLNV